MEAWTTSQDAQGRLKMVEEALAEHEANGTQDSLLAQRLRESREHYLQFAKPSMGDKMMVREQDSNPSFTGRSSAARATAAHRSSGNASEKARGYATSLWNQRQSEQLQTAEPDLYREGLRLIEKDLIDPRDCSRLIDALKNLPWRERASRPAATDTTLRPAAELESGYYRKGDEFFRVKISKTSGHAYAELWIDGHWNYEGARGVVRHLTPAMVLTAEDAKAFGDQYHACVYCSTELTDDRSVRAGYGPKCASKHSLPWG